ncbi:MAG: GUN4 domain-containing protein [Crocosphaera sp.]
MSESYSNRTKEELEHLYLSQTQVGKSKLILDEYTKRFTQELLNQVGWKTGQEKSVSSPRPPEAKRISRQSEYSIKNKNPSPEKQGRTEKLTVNQLLSRQGVNYTQLRKFLVAEEWKLADQETMRVMLKAASREQQGFLDAQSLKSISSEDLKIIDHLWVQHSKGRFGFSVQKRIYQSLEWTGQYNYRIFGKFLRKIGWFWVFSPVRAYNGLKVKRKTADGYLPGIFLPLWNRLLLDYNKRVNRAFFSIFFACILLGVVIAFAASSSVEDDVFAGIILVSFVVGLILFLIFFSITFNQIIQNFFKTWVSHILMFDDY